MIREIGLCDVAECVKVIKTSFLTVADYFGFTVENAPRFTAFAITEEKLGKQLSENNRVMYAAFDNGVIVGCFSLLLQNDGECEINYLSVLPVYRHCGIGADLLRYAFRIAEKLGCTKINIGIIEENQVLKNWYESFGFVHTSTQKFDFFPFTCGYMEKYL